VVLRFTGQIPGRKSVGLVRGYGGSLALTNKRVLGTMSVLPGEDRRAIDQPWNAAQAGTVQGTRCFGPCPVAHAGVRCPA